MDDHMDQSLLGIRLIAGFTFGFVSFLMACGAAAFENSILEAWFVGGSVMVGLVAVIAFGAAAIGG